MPRIQKLVYMSPDLPDVTSDWWQPFAQNLFDKFMWFSDERGPIEDRWNECDAAYLAYRKLPYMESMPYIDTSDFGSSVVFDAVNALSIRLALSIMPKDDSWLTVKGNSGESPALIKQVQQQQTWVHRLAKSRRKFCRHLKQLVVRGGSHLYLQWKTVERYQRLGTTKGRRLLKKHLLTMGADPEVAKQVNMVRQAQTVYNGPAPLVMDMFDVFLDPESDMLYADDERPAYFMRLFLRPSTLKNTKDDADQAVYKNLKNLEGSRVGDLRHDAQDGDRRDRSRQILSIGGVDDESPHSALAVPVYVYYSPYEEYDGVEFYDTYFYIAVGSDGIPRMIRVEENPSFSGHNHLLTDTYIDWFTNVAYGISGVDKVLSAYHQLNFMEAIQLNAMAVSQFPAYMMAGGRLVQDMLKVAPGAINEIAEMAVGEDWIRTIPTPDRGVQLGFQDISYYTNKIGRSFETAGANSQEAAAVQGAVSNRETATSVNYKASSQGMAVDEQGEKFSDTLQLYCQWVYDENIATAQPNAQDEIEFGVVNGQNVDSGAININQWAVPRSVQVLGVKAVVNQQQSRQEKREGFSAIGQAAQMVPNAPVLGSAVLKSYLQDLNVDTPEEAWMTPQEMLMQDPNLLIQAASEALQNPETAMAVMENLPPEVRQALGRAMHMINQQNLQGGMNGQGSRGDQASPPPAPSGPPAGAPAQPAGG